jgi:C1A family cysteine protease
MRTQKAQPGPVATSLRQAIATGQTIPKFHWRPDPVDTRDHIFSLTATAPLPQRVDLRPYASPIDDQGQLGSCTGNAIAGAIDLIDNKNHKALRVSRLFIYYQERVLEGDITYDNGAYIRDGIKACNQTGAPLESYWPYIINEFAVKPSAAAYTDAAKRKVIGYSKCTDFNSVKTAIAAGNPVVGGFYVYSSFETGTWWQPRGTGLMPYPNTRTEQLLGGHAVCFVGYDDNLSGPAGRGYFIVRNSWGTSWGQQGYFYMPYQVVQNTAMSSDFWVINGVTNP